MQQVMTSLQTEIGNDLSYWSADLPSQYYVERVVWECAGDKPLAALFHNISLPFFLSYLDEWIYSLRG